MFYACYLKATKLYLYKNQFSEMVYVFKDLRGKAMITRPERVQ